MTCIRCNQELGYQVAINTKELKLFYDENIDEIQLDKKGIKVCGAINDDRTINSFQLLCENCIKHFNKCKTFNNLERELNILKSKYDKKIGGCRDCNNMIIRKQIYESGHVRILYFCIYSRSYFPEEALDLCMCSLYLPLEKTCTKCFNFILDEFVGKNHKIIRLSDPSCTKGFEFQNKDFFKYKNYCEKFTRELKYRKEDK